MMKLKDLTDLTAKMEGAHAYQAAKGNRQIMYQFAKLVPSYEALYSEAQDFYVRLCDAMGVEPEPVFDLEAYQKSDRYLRIINGIEY